MKKPITIRLKEETLERLHKVKEDTGISIQTLLEKSFERSEFYVEQKN